jgi:hypothetical protein
VGPPFRGRDAAYFLSVSRNKRALRQQEQARDQRHREDAGVVFAEAGFSQEITAVRGGNGAVT